MRLLKYWHSSSEVITNLHHEWVKTDEWEKIQNAHFIGRLLHSYDNFLNLVPSLQDSLLLWTPLSQMTSGCDR